MSHKRMRAVGVVLAGAAIAAAATGCSTSESVDPAVARALDSALVDGEFPAGYSVVKLGKDDRTVMSDQLAESRKDAEVTPAVCKSTGAAPDDAETGSVVAVPGAAALSQSVARTTTDLAQLSAAVSGECATVTVKVTTGAASGTTVVVDHTDVSSPSIGGHQGVVFTQVTTTTGDQPERRQMLVGRVPVGGYLVTVQAVNVDGSAPDRGAFTETLEAAVHKTAAA